jgi:hypothetical protein
MSDIDDRLDRLESRLERQQETIEAQQERIEELAGSSEGGGVPATESTLVNRRTALKTGGLLAVLGIGVGTASADPQGQVGRDGDPLRALYAAELNGPVTGREPVTDLLGDGLGVDSGTLSTDLGTGLSFDNSNRIALPNDALTVAGNSVSLGGSTDVDHADLTGIGAVDHHTRPSAGTGLRESSDSFAVAPTKFAGRNLVASEGSLDYDPPENVVVVAKSGGDYADVGAALDSVSGPGVVWVAPGEYDVSQTTNDIPAEVSLVGAGRDSTTLYNTGFRAFEVSNSAEMRSLTIEQRGGVESGTASVVEMNASLKKLRMQDVRVTQTELEEQIGITVLNGIVSLHNVTVRMDSFGRSTAVIVVDSGSLTARDSVLAGGGGREGYALNVLGSAEVANTQLENGVKLTTDGFLDEVGTYDGEYNAR